MTDYSKIIWNENPVNGALHDWHGIVSSGILITFIICQSSHAICSMLWHWLNWHDPSALQQASLYLFATALQCEACTVVHWQMMVFIWFYDHCHHYVTMFFVFIKLSEWNSLLPHNLIPHRCYDLGEWYVIAHGVEGSLYCLTNALEEITYLVSRLLHREFPSLFPINATMASWSTPSIFSISIVTDFAYRTVLYVQFTRIRFPLINLWIIAFFPITIRGETWYHTMCRHAQIWAVLRYPSPTHSSEQWYDIVLSFDLSDLT